MPTDPAQVAAIADGLTVTQRDAIIDAHDMMAAPHGQPMLAVRFNVFEPWPRGLTQFLSFSVDTLTPLGLAVRAHLLAAKETPHD